MARVRHRHAPNWARQLYDTVSLPLAVVFLLSSHRIHPAYGMNWRRMYQLAWRMRRTREHVPTATSVRAHLAIAAKLLEVPPDVPGDVVECGCFRGGSTANLSLVCDIVGRNLIVYDSFEGLPAAEPGDRYAKPEGEGFLRGELDEVKANVARFGAPERVTYRKGWFKDTLPHHDTPVVLCFVDVDYQASLHDCVVHLWPHLTERGWFFIDEYVYLDYCALFWSESWWREHFDTTPPGLIGSGAGVGVGQFYLGPFNERPFIQLPYSVAYTRKDFDGHWSYRPAEAATGNGTEAAARA